MSAESTSEIEKPWKLNFFSIWTGQAFSLLGSRLVGFALIWWLTVKFGSGTMLAAASLVGILPEVFLGPIVGVLVDRWNRRWVMALADSTIAVATLLLFFLFAAGVAQPWHVFVILFIRAVGGGFHYPAMMASTTLMVPKTQFTRVQGLNQILQGALSVVAAPLGALLLDVMDIHWILLIDVGTAMLAVLPLFFAKVPQPVRTPQQAGASAPSVWTEFKEGLRYVWSWPGLFAMLLLATMINMVVSPAFSLLPLLVKNHFQGQAINLATLESALGFGMLGGGLLLGVWGGFKRKIKTSMLGLCIMGLSMIALGAAPGKLFIIAVIANFFIGSALALANGPLHAIIQSVVDPDKQGRVITLIGSVATAMTPIGLGLAGPIADLLGVQTWFIAGGIITLAMAACGVLIPAIYHLEDNHHKATADSGRMTTEPLVAAASGDD